MPLNIWILTFDLHRLTTLRRELSVGLFPFEAESFSSNLLFLLIVEQLVSQLRHLYLWAVCRSTMAMILKE